MYCLTINFIGIIEGWSKSGTVVIHNRIYTKMSFGMVNHDWSEVMTVLKQNTCDWIVVEKSFYMTFDGRRCYCNIPELYMNNKFAQMIIRYKQGDEEIYSLTSADGFLFSGTTGTNDDSRVEFEKWVCDQSIILAGGWKCGGNEGEWYIEGFVKSDYLS